MPSKGLQFIETIDPIISVITQIELLGWHGASDKQLVPLIDFVEKAAIFPLESDIIQETISLRQKFKIKTPDAIIAATALTHNLSLLTRNTADFKQIPELRLINPFEL
ncbi:type II toxin-antitoxin system VapC family toxin [Compostibacter hankyongensis]|uniref:PIN domain-containing protein n=1 Tax=Compostibacter hankyongensis TaxID=1007089 RepID=A0ABP8G8I5_9BACT